MTKKISMTMKEVTLALTVICPRCGAFPNKRCVNTKTGLRKKAPHEARLELAKNPPKPMMQSASAVNVMAFKPDPKAKLTKEQKEIADLLVEKIHAIGGHAEFIGPVSEGPLISTYRVMPKQGTRVSAIEGMAKDFEVALGTDEPILVQRMLGESAVGIYIPNRVRTIIDFKDTMEAVMQYMAKRPVDHLPIPINFGVDQLGNPFIGDLTMFPHLLVAGSTDSGKSTLLHCIGASMPFALTSKQLKLVISDPKGVEFPQWNAMPHLWLGPGSVATDMYTTMKQMQLLLDEIKHRQILLQQRSVRNIHGYNRLVNENERMPYIVLILDELASLMGESVEKGEAKLNAQKLQGLVQYARFVGIYIIAATQRPDVKTVGGTIKANFPARLSLRLPNQVDSRTVLGTKGAERLMSRGDMLFMSPQHQSLLRLHAPLTHIDDVLACVQYASHRDNEIVNSPNDSMPVGRIQ